MAGFTRHLSSILRRSVIANHHIPCAAKPEASGSFEGLAVRSFNSDTWGQVKEEDVERPATPWVRTVSSGVDLLRNPKYNKGMAFTPAEREASYLLGLLPPAYMTQDLQVERVLENLKEYTSNLHKYSHLMSLQERNERLFYRVLLDYIEDLMPIISGPTVGLACRRYGLLFRRPRGIFITNNDKGRVLTLLKNWPEKRVRFIVVTDGEQIMGLGDLGANGMGIPVGKLSLYTACGGINPSECLPVMIDVGTNNQALLQDPFYIGVRHSRVKGEEYDELLDEFMEAAKARFGDKCLIQFQDLANHNAHRLHFQYRGSHLVFNDNIQGTAAVLLAGIKAAQPLTNCPVSQHTYLFTGAGELECSIAELVALGISREAKITIQEARQKICFVDSKGLVTRARAENLRPHKLPFAHNNAEAPDLLAAVKVVKPTVLVGLSAPRGAFTQQVLEEMALNVKRPLLFPLSNPASSEEGECSAEDAYQHTQGRGIFASASPSKPVEIFGQTFQPSQANNAYIFPGIGLGLLVAGTTRIRDEMFLAAADTLASLVEDEDRARGQIYPPFWKIRTISAHIARAVAQKSYEAGFGTRLPKPDDLMAFAHEIMYKPHYRRLR
ncbi:malate dehydrogenase [Klebsormidium nitens]|uniref:Malate dehydrogenase n=1 Tax=Klebsormidium nitens TaxID=105231 RepID=A0A1Y1HS85_KLENI|nr:malate dehydrogenase [Klebsormidium nitens]|eukprot:GAQ80039.1 malate dehydrogenase [Klebsormidium nitens]